MTFVHASVGPVLSWYRLDPAEATLEKGGAVTLPANVQYAWPDRNGRLLYVATSDAVPGLGIAGGMHHLSAFSVDPRSGALTPHGVPVELPARPIHLSLDRDSRHALLAFSAPAAVRVVRIAADGTLVRLLEDEPIDPGIFPHQILVTPEGDRAILVSRGHAKAAGRAEQPGALHIFSYADGQLTSQRVVAPNGGYDFQPRHLDFHPSRPWVYVSLEHQNRLAMFACEDDGMLETAPRFQVSSLSAGGQGPQQMAGAIHVHPAGHTVYVANRSPEVLSGDERTPFTGGDNTIVAFAIDPDTGEPREAQRIDTRGLHCRTFQIDPSSRLLIAAHVIGLPVQEGMVERVVPAGLSIFRVADDGQLTFVRRYDEKTGPQLLFWMGMVTPRDAV